MKFKVIGKDFIEVIAKRLDRENVRCYDSAIVNKIRELTAAQLLEIVTFGNVVKWHNESINSGEKVKINP